MRVLHQLLDPFSYLSIKHEAKRKVDWVAPIVATSVCTILFLVCNQIFKIDVFSTNGSLTKILGFTQSLPGFYIAALAAIATFNRRDIDFIMPAPIPHIEVITDKGNVKEINLTRRRFLCLMFAFLTAESILLIGIAIAAGAIAEPIKQLLPEATHIWLKIAFVWIYGLLLWQLLMATFWGLYYLGSKLHEGEKHTPLPPYSRHVQSVDCDVVP